MTSAELCNVNNVLSPSLRRMISRPISLTGSRRMVVSMEYDSMQGGLVSWKATAGFLVGGLPRRTGWTYPRVRKT